MKKILTLAYLTWCLVATVAAGPAAGAALVPPDGGGGVPAGTRGEGDAGSRRISLPETMDEGREPGRSLPEGAEEDPRAKGAKKGLPPEENGKILLQVEPADGSLFLRWRVAGARLTSGGSPPFRFTIQVGPEAGRYDRRVEVGTVQEYRLAGLDNHRVYHLKVQATSREGGTIASAEEQATPLPEEELGSLLERQFSTTPVTLQDRPDLIESPPFPRRLKQFGYDFFKNSIAAAPPAGTSPVGSDYVLGPGDSVRIDIWGTVAARHELEVDRNGEIVIPRVGVVKLWGLSYAQAREAIDRAVSRYFKGYQLNVSLGSLRTMQIYVVGEVQAPGAYQVGAVGTVVNALAAAGGPAKSGSLRGVKLMRGGKVVQEIDLYDIFLAGDRSTDLRLQNGDTLFVPVLGPVVAVAGEVKRPAVYELKGATSLARVIEMAGGMTAAGFRGRIQLERFDANSARVISDFASKGGSLPETLGEVEVHDRDMVKVFPVQKVLRQVVSLRGHVARPGEYQYRDGMRVTDIIARYDDLLPESWPDAAEIIRLSPPDFHREVLTFNLGKALAGDPSENLLLHEQDTIRIFAKREKEEKQTVAITGQVVKPGIFDYYRNMTVRDLVAAAGSPRWNAFLDDAELTRIVVEEGRAKSTRLQIDLGRALAGDPKHNLVLLPNDTLIVRSIVDWLDATERFVTLKGEVRFPGTYSIAKGERLSSVIARAGGYTAKAYLKGARFTRVSVRENQQQRMEEVIAKSEQDVLKKQAELSSLAASKEELEATRASLDGLMASLQKLKQTKAEGRVVVELAPLEQLKFSSYDVELMGGDLLDIPTTPNVVNVMGYVYNTTTLIHVPGKSLTHYLKKAGGPTRDADEDALYVIKVDGTVVSREQSDFGIGWNDEAKRWVFGGLMSAPLDPGDTLVVPQKLDRIAWLREIKDITTIVSQIALTAGTILVGLR